MVKNPTSNGGDQGLIPGQGTKIPHSLGKLSRHAATREKPNQRNKNPMCGN